MAKSKPRKPANNPRGVAGARAAKRDAVALIYSGYRHTEWVEPATLFANPLNWRTHPPHQKAECRESIAACGWSKPLICNLTTGNLIDGHLRLEIAVEDKVAQIPVNFGEWSDEQERTLIAVLDPISARAGADRDRFQGLREKLTTQGPALKALLDAEQTRLFEALLREQARTPAPQPQSTTDPEPALSPGSKTEPTPAPQPTAQQEGHPFHVLLAPDQYEPVIAAVNRAKVAFGVDTSAVAICRICEEWLESQPEA